MAGPSTAERAAGMKPYFNRRNVQVGYPINQTGRLVVLPDGEDGTLTARLWHNDGTVLGELAFVLHFDLGSRGTTQWQLTGIDTADGNTQTWEVKGGGCGCGK